MGSEKWLKENIEYGRIASLIGPSLARFCMCAVYDVAFDDEMEAENWQGYRESVENKTFAEGDTDINSAILAGMPTRERWETIWGDGFTESDYKQLDHYYNVMTSQLDGTGGLDPQQRDAAMSCAKMRLNKDKLLLNYKDKDAISTAKQLDQMIRETLKDSNMRKADILPTQAQRLDGFVDAMRKDGLSPEMTQDDVFEWFYRKCKQKKYKMTTDAADWMLLSILKTMSKNNDQPEPMELDADMSLAAFESEFAEEANEQEQLTYDYLGFVRGGASGKSTVVTNGAQNGESLVQGNGLDFQADRG